MAFWGTEVKPGKPFTHRFDQQRGRLHISQATLGIGSQTQKSIVQCNIGNKSPVLLCALLPEKTESCHLALEFEEEEDVVFSVLGPRSVHLTGFYNGTPIRGHDDDSESYGEDIAQTDTDRSFDTEEDYDSDFIDDGDLEMFPPSSNRKSAVEIEEMLDDEKPANSKANGGRKRLRKKYRISDSESDDEKQVVVNGNASSAVLASEDDDSLPISSITKKKDTTKTNEQGKSEKKSTKKSKKNVEDNGDQDTCKKRKLEIIVQDDKAEESKVPEQSKDSSMTPTEVKLESDVKPKKKKKEKSKEKKSDADEVKPKVEMIVEMDQEPVEDALKEERHNDKSTENADNVADGNHSEGKKKKKKKSKAQESDKNTNAEEKEEPTVKTEDKKEKVKQSKEKTFANGLSEEIKMGKPERKRASRGNKVSGRS